VVLEVLCEVDPSHAPSADFPLDDVAVGEGGFETVEGIGHGASLWLAVSSKMGPADLGASPQAAGFDATCEGITAAMTNAPSRTSWRLGNNCLHITLHTLEG